MCNMAVLQRFAGFVLTFSAIAVSIPCLHAQIVEIREQNGQQLSCSSSGLRGFSMPCGTDGGATYVFVGSILSITEIAANEKQLSVAPEEIFHGSPAAALAVVTSQGDCLPEIRLGDHWLFYLWNEKESNKLFLSYASGSAPVANAQKNIALLRRLAKMSNEGTINGSVQLESQNDADRDSNYSQIQGHKIIARAADGAEYVTATDDEGNYEFESLEAGSYHLTANTTDGLWAEEGAVKVHPHSCSVVEFELYPDGVISGHIRMPDGHSEKTIWVEAQKASDDDRNSRETHSTIVDENGNFEFRGLRPGRYFIGIGIGAGKETPEWKNRVYYPGVKNESRAIVIELGKATKRTNINFQLLAR